MKMKLVMKAEWNACVLCVIQQCNSLSVSLYSVKKEITFKIIFYAFTLYGYIPYTFDKLSWKKKFRSSE